MNKEAKGFALAFLAGIAVALVVCLVGCAKPQDAMPVSEKRRLGAYLAIVVASQPSVVPQPTVPEGDVCPDCNGAGKVGDGTVFRTCLTCNGSGRKPKEEPPEQPKLEPKPTKLASPPNDGRVYRKVCRNGTCTWELVQ